MAHALDHYEVLGIPRSAAPAEIRAAYRRVVKNVHPDANGPSSLFLLVQEAYEVLGDADRRAAYDRGERPVSRSSTDAFEVEPDEAAEPDYVPESADTVEDAYVVDDWPSADPPPTPGSWDRVPPPYWPPPGVTSAPRREERPVVGIPDWPVYKWRVSRLALAVPLPAGRRAKAALFVGWFLLAGVISDAGRGGGGARYFAAVALIAGFYLPALLLLLRGVLVLGVRVERLTRLAGARRRRAEARR